MLILGPGLLSEGETWIWGAVVSRTWGRSGENQHCDPLAAVANLPSTQKAWLVAVAKLHQRHGWILLPASKTCPTLIT